MPILVGFFAITRAKWYNFCMIWQTFGHNKVKLLLNRQLDKNILPHAYIFAGPDGVGKKVLALELAKKVLQTENLQNHPDFQTLDIIGEIPMEAAKEFIGQMSLKPFVAQKKVAIINNAQNLNLQSGNALLKTLEEPSAHNVIILISSGKLLPTIVSRCQVLRFNVFSLSGLKEFAKILRLDVSEEMLELSCGSTARLKLLAENAEYLAQEKNLVNLFKKLSAQTPGNKLAAVNKIADQETEDLQKYFVSWFNWQNFRLRSEPREFVKVRALLDAMESLNANKNKKLILQTLMFKI